MSTNIKTIWKTLLFVSLSFCLLLATPSLAKTVKLKGRKTTAGVYTVDQNVLKVDTPTNSDENANAQYMWYRKKGKRWKRVGSSQKLSVRFSKCGKYKFKCVYRTDESEPWTTKHATIYVGDEDLFIETHPFDETARIGSKTRFEIIIADGNPLATYQWQRKKGDGEWKNVKGATDVVYEFIPTKDDDGCRYRCVVSQPKLKLKVRSRSAKLTVIQASKGVDESKAETFRGMFMPKSSDGRILVCAVDRRYSLSARIATSCLNDMVGEEAFVYASDERDADLILTSYNGDDGTAVGAERFDPNDLSECFRNKEWGGVATSNGATGLHRLIAVNEAMYAPNDFGTDAVIMHEILHCVGVGHSKNPCSLMYPQMSSKTKITDEDCAVAKKQVKKFREALSRATK